MQTPQTPSQKSALHKLPCEPCNSGSITLNRTQAQQLLQDIPQWNLTEDATWLERRFHFQDYAHTVAFVQKVATLAEAQGHHPDISFTWGKCHIRIQTHKIHGLHKNDFILAARINQISQT